MSTPLPLGLAPYISPTTLMTAPTLKGEAVSPWN